jgi:hypothetical protein
MPKGTKQHGSSLTITTKIKLEKMISIVLLHRSQIYLISIHIQSLIESYDMQL